MPVLYVVGFLFFFITFITNKFALIHYYQKTNTLNRVVPTYSVGVLTYAILFHMVVGVFMLTNSSIFKTKEHHSDALEKMTFI